ncbi:MAG: hypothetical protein JJT94_05330, partial [Bernardetiaceae bacterium]|nr:hypothetical protein [Bernardetiaceae bacterium]
KNIDSKLLENNIELLQSLSQTTILEDLVDIRKDRNYKTVSPNAEIIQYWQSSLSGHIRFKKSNGNVILANFKSDDIIEDSIKDTLLKEEVTDQKPVQVFCYIEGDRKRNRKKSHYEFKRAYAIQYPKKLDVLLGWVSNAITNEEYEDAKGILDVLKYQYPAEEKINDLLEKIPETQLLVEPTLILKVVKR